MGDCEVRVWQSNDVKPRILAHNDEKIDVQSICSCGNGCDRYSFQSMQPIIVEKICQVKAEALAKHYVSARFPKNTVASYPITCKQCDRQFTLSIEFELKNQWLKTFEKRYRHGELRFLYGDSLILEISVNEGFYADGRHTIEEVLHPNHACNTPLQPTQLLSSFQKLINAFDEFWANGDDSKLKPINIDEKCKCLFCLGEAEIKAKITPILPKKDANPSEIIEQHESWMRRTRE